MSLIVYFLIMGFQAELFTTFTITCQTGHTRHLENTFEIPVLYDRQEHEKRQKRLLND